LYEDWRASPNDGRQTDRQTDRQVVIYLSKGDTLAVYYYLKVLPFNG
jgi:hypothetical protein